MDDKIIKKPNEKSILNGGNGEKKPMSLVRKKFALMDERKKNAN